MAKKDDREKKIADICAAINKGAFGGDEHNAVTYLGSRDAIALERFPSGSPKLDEALGGGWPKGRQAEIFGPESGGKTTLALHAIAEYQKKYPDDEVALIDTEFSFDQEYAENIGVNTKYLIVHQPDSGDQALNILRQLIQMGVACIVVDSVAALTTKAELDGDLGDQQVADQARLMSRSLRTLTGEAGRRQATIFWTNQVREKIGVMWGDKTTTPAGRALKHYASIRVQIVAIGKNTEQDGKDKIVVSSKNKATVKKNKTAAPFKVAEFCISFGHGIDHAAEVLDTAMSFKVVTKKGSTISFGEEILAVGHAATLERIRGDVELMARVEKAIEGAKEAGVNPESEKQDEGDQIKKPSFSKTKKVSATVDENEEPEVSETKVEDA